MLSILEEFAAVTRRQLSDFLPDGAYSAPATPEERQEMAHSKLNNVFGEACLGDLHFSLFKRRHSSVHHHSTVNMMKRNKPITKFLLKKSAAVQKRLVSFSRRKAVSVREEHRQREKAVIIERQQYLQEQKVKSDLLTARRRSRKMEVIRAVQDRGGLSLQRELGEDAVATQNKNSQVPGTRCAVALPPHHPG